MNAHLFGLVVMTIIPLVIWGMVDDVHDIRQRSFSQTLPIICISATILGGVGVVAFCLGLAGYLFSL